MTLHKNFAKLISQDPQNYKVTHDALWPCTKHADDYILDPPFRSPTTLNDIRFLDASRTTLLWHNIFVTRRGHLGLGPAWLTPGDTVMAVRGAPVLFAFCSAETELARRERDIRAAMDENEKKLQETSVLRQGGKRKALKDSGMAVRYVRTRGKLERLEREWVGLRGELERVGKEGVVEGGWVLRGEVYTRGFMGGEGVSERGRGGLRLFDGGWAWKDDVGLRPG
ncbi:hypothetical protein EJ04DRAFT_527866 [Polyplosphaeria fusca]|uniref:Uncharacterized protein n=1 Tax=Polyplosphaeria fusca TaxID=682080 RepID=A0A9P4UXT1_9PLEO|nr:hypothetical protein EJ04DRAFT_527866 [Polyplosphaeria fusca]